MSNAKTVRRGSHAGKRAAPRRKSVRRVARRSIAARVAAVLPFSEAGIRRAGVWSFAALIAGAVGAAMWMVRLPQTAAWEAGEGIGRLGFAVERVEVRGLERMTEHQIHEAALAGDSLAMTNIDLTDIRARVEAIGWVRSARVSRRLPDTLVIAIEERAPVAIWQHRGALTLIDIEGEPLGPIELDAMPDLPLIVGPGANRQVAAYVALIDAAPALRPMLEGATWIGSRRWDLRFQSGEELALPEGDEEAARALVRFARMDGVTGLLGEGFNRFDMRLPDRLVVRVPRERARREAGEDASENI